MRLAISGKPLRWVSALSAFICIGALVSGFVHGDAGRPVVFAEDSPSKVQRFYADDSFWNTPIPADASTDPNSNDIVARAIIPYRSNANFTNGDAWGISVVTADPSSKSYEIICKKYGCGDRIEFPMPQVAVPDTGSDHHLVVISGNQELDLWLASYDSRHDQWSAGSRRITDLDGWGACGPPGTHCVGGVAAGFAEMGGVVRPEEIQQGHIDHALSITLPYTRDRFIACPATHTDGKYNDPNAIPEGAHIQLDPSFNVDSQHWPQWEKVIAKALQTYGAYISDTGGSMAVYGQSDINPGNLKWREIGVPKNSPSLSNLPWDRVRVLTIQSCN
jgi:hypothetical protein